MINLRNLILKYGNSKEIETAVIELQTEIEMAA